MFWYIKHQFYEYVLLMLNPCRKYVTDEYANQRSDLQQRRCNTVFIHFHAVLIKQKRVCVCNLETLFQITTMFASNFHIVWLDSV